MPALDRIDVKGFKSIREMSLELRPLNVLIGANGSGKSNFISVFRLLNAIAEGHLQVFVGRSGVDALLHFGQKSTNEIGIKADFGHYGYEIELVPSSDDNLLFAVEKLSFGSSTVRRISVNLGTGHRETLLEDKALNWSKSFPPPEAVDRISEAVGERPGNLAEQTLNALKSWKVYHFHDTSDSAKVKLTGALDDNTVLRPDASNLAAYLYLLRERYRPYYDRIVKTIRLIAPFFDDFVLEPSRLNPEKIRLEWHEKGSDLYFNASVLPDGLLRFICLSTLLLQPTLPSNILIDEPELGLHPYAINLLGGMLRSVAAQNHQVIVTTQSVSFVNQFSPEDIVVVDRQDGGSHFERLTADNLERWLEDYTLGELWEKNVIGGRPQR